MPIDHLIKFLVQQFGLNAVQAAANFIEEQKSSPRTSPEQTTSPTPKIIRLNGYEIKHHAILIGANLVGLNLQNADLFAANLSDADLSGADLSGADLRNANLTCANLTGANLRGANLEDANLTGAKLSGTIMPDGTILKIISTD